MNLNIASGLIIALCGIAGLIVIIFFTSPAVTLPFQAMGFFGFVSVFMYGLFKASDAAVQADIDFQANN